MHETIWHSLIVAFTIIIQKLDLTFNSFASGWAALCESCESKYSIMFIKTKGRYQKNAHHVQSLCLSTNRVNGFSKLGHWNCNLEVPQLAHLYLMVPDSTTTTKHSTIPVFVWKFSFPFLHCSSKMKCKFSQRVNNTRALFLQINTPLCYMDAFIFVYD